jgi:hypothetical protein
VTKRAIARAAMGIETATKRVMAADGNIVGNGYGNVGDRRLMAATKATAQRTQPLAL